jgi:signal transduction histidine kinase
MAPVDPADVAARDAGIKGAVGVPIEVAGTAWRSICAVTTKIEPIPLDAEGRLGRFRDLVATSPTRSCARRSPRRARVIAAADDARRQIEPDLHDGAQQRVVTLTVALRRAAANVPSGSDELRTDVNRIAEDLITAVQELRELSQGIHPAELSEGGLSPALKALGRRSALRVELDVPFDDRLPDHVEVAAYYTVSEALTNASKHSDAKRVWVSLDLVGDVLRLSIRDDGIGGADASLGSRLTGLRDRIEALGGRLHMESPPERGTSIEVEIPAGQSTDQAGRARGEVVASGGPWAVWGAEASNTGVIRFGLEADSMG